MKGENKKLVKCERCHQIEPLGEITDPTAGEERGLCVNCMIEVSKKRYDNKINS